MASVKISGSSVPFALPAAATLTGAELIPMDQTVSGVTTTVAATASAIAALGGGGSSTTLSSVILADTPFAFWKLDDASGSPADSSGNGYNLNIVTGGINYRSTGLINQPTADLFLNVGGFSGAGTLYSAGLAINSALGQTLPLTNWTAEFIVASFGGGTVRYIDWRVSSSAPIIVLYNIGTGLTADINNSNVQLVPFAPNNAGKPVHVVVTCSTSGGSSTYSTYYNGVLVYVLSGQSPSTSSGGTPQFGIGYAPTYGGTTSPFNMGYAALYSSVLTPARVAAHAAAAGMLGT